jgi:hypothetical protein
MRRAGELLRRGAAFLTVLWPTVGVPALALASLLRRDRPPAGFVRSWWFAWGPLLALGIAHAVGRWGGTATAAWAGLALGVGWIVAGARFAPFRPLLAALAVTVTVLAAEGAVATSTWHPTDASGVGLERLVATFGSQRLDGPNRYERVWRGHDRDGPTVVSLELRSVDGPSGWSWYAYDAGFVVEPLPRGPDGYARITPPAHGGSYVTRRIDTHAALAGRTFRARLRLRAAEPFEAAAPACRGVLLREVGGTNATACFPLALGTEWSDHEFAWDVPATATSSLIRIELRIGTASFEVGDVELEEAVPAGWRSFGPLEPAGVRLIAAIPGVAPIGWITEVVLPTPDWQRVTVRLDDPRIAPDADLRLIVHPEARTAVEVRGTDVRRPIDDDAATVRLTPLPRPLRRSAAFGHPNLAGHGLALAGLLTVASAPTLVGALAAAALTLGGVAWTGSRAAWIVALFGIVALLLRGRRAQGARLRGPTIPLLIAAVALAALLGLSLRGSTPGALQVLGRGAANEVSRVEILTFAARTMLAHPLAGIGEDGFAERWRAANPDDRRTVPQHGHNLWLHLGATHGLPGFAAALWLSAALLGVSWRWGGRSGRVVVVAALLLQLTDFTLPYAGVLGPLLLALGRAEARATDGPT